MFEFEGLSLALRPFIFTPYDVPLVTDVDVDAVFPALAEALRTLGPAKAISCYDIVLAGLPQAPRARWEAYMTTTLTYEYRSDVLRKSFAEGKAQGEVQGEARGRRPGGADRAGSARGAGVRGHP